MLLFSQLMDFAIVFFRYYDFKRTAEKKEHKTIEAAGKVRKLFDSTQVLGKNQFICKIGIYCSVSVNVMYLCHSRL